MKNYGLFIGIDISKKYIDVSLTLDGNKLKMLHCRFENNLKGFKKMLAWIKKYLSANKIKENYLFLMEHTGIYTLSLCAFLQEKNLDYALESGLQIKRSLGIRRGKSDKSDSKDIAKYAAMNFKTLRINNLPSDKLMKLKNLLTFRAKLVKQKVMHLAYCNEFKKLMPVQYKVDLIQQSAEQFIKTINKNIVQIEKEMRSIIQEDKELNRLYNLVVSVKGIGIVIASTMLVYTNAFKAFKNARQFSCYIAIAPFGEQSGTSIKIDPKVSHLGHKKIKALFSNACCSAIQHDKQIKAYFNRKIKEGKSEGCVYNAVKNKLIARIFAVVKRGTPFVEFAY